MLTDGWDNSAGSWQWTADGGTLLFVAELRARINLYAIGAQGGTPRELHRGGALAGVEVTRDRRCRLPAPLPSTRRRSWRW